MVDKTPNHELNKYQQGETNWDHSDDMATIEKRLVINDVEANRSNYEPHEDATFRATDTGAVFDGDGSSWNKATRAYSELHTEAASIDKWSATYRYTVHEDGGTIYGIGRGGEVVTTGTAGTDSSNPGDFASVVNTLISESGDHPIRIHIAPKSSGDAWFVEETIYAPKAIRLTGEIAQTWGANTHGTQLWAADGLNDDMIHFRAADEYIVGSKVENIYIEGNQDNNTSGDMIYVDDGAVQDGSDVYIVDTIMMHPADNCVHIDNCSHNFYIRGSMVEHANGAGVLIESDSSNFNKFYSTDTFYLSNGTGLDIRSGESMNVINSKGDVFERNDVGIHTRGSDYIEQCNISANFWANSSEAILLENAHVHQLTVQGNFLFNATSGTDTIHENGSTVYNRQHLYLCNFRGDGDNPPQHHINYTQSEYPVIVVGSYEEYSATDPFSLPSGSEQLTVDTTT